MRVAEVAAEATHDLRRKVLREGRADAVVTFDEDAHAGTRHLVVLDDNEAVVATATFVPHAGGVWQLRGMAVDPAVQGQGVGRLALDAGVALVQAAGGRHLWANGRDTALAFYERCGWIVVGEGFFTPTGLPHHRIERDLGA